MKLKLALSVAGIVALVAGPALAKPSQPSRGDHVRNVTQQVVDLQGRVIGADPDQKVRFELSRDIFLSYN